MLTFKQWLSEQAHKDSSIGDLARDVKQDKNFPRLDKIDKYMMNFEKTKKYLEEKGAFDNALITLYHAWLSYNWYLMVESADMCEVTPNEVEYRNRLSCIIESGHGHLYMNSTKEEAIEHLINIAKGVSH